jgi:ABC-type antimicrobial peptide transport system permease subunit
MGFENSYSPTEYIKSMKEMTASLQLLLAAIGGISLLIAAIGIANTMIMAIYERTKEIGIMKVIGATLRDIKQLSLILVQTAKDKQSDHSQAVKDEMMD